MGFKCWPPPDAKNAAESRYSIESIPYVRITTTKPFKSTDTFLDDQRGSLVKAEKVRKLDESPLYDALYIKELIQQC